MAASTWSWFGGSGQGDNPSYWTLVAGPGTGGFPQSGDTAITAGGTLLFGDASLSSNTIEAGGTAGAVAVISSNNTVTNYGTPALDGTSVLNSAVPGHSTAETTVLNAAGSFINDGRIIADGPAGSVFIINVQQGTSSGSFTPGYFINTGQMEVDAGNTLVVSIGQNSELMNAALIRVNGGSLDITTTGTPIAGGYAPVRGVMLIENGGTAELNVGVPSGTPGPAGRIAFGRGSGNTLILDQVTQLASRIDNFNVGDTIDIGKLTVNNLTYNADGRLVLNNGTATVATLALWSGAFQTGSFAVSGGTAGSFGISTAPNGDTLITTSSTASVWNDNTGVWESTANWSGNTVPGASDAVVIGQGEQNTFTVAVNAPESAASLILADRNALLQINSSLTVLPNLMQVMAGTLEVTGTGSLVTGALGLIGAGTSLLLDPGAKVNVTGHVNMGGANNGTIALQSGNNFALSLSGSGTINGATLNAGPGQPFSGSTGGSFVIGNTGGGTPATLLVENAATVTDTYAYLSSGATSFGQLTIDGSKTTWTDAGDPTDTLTTRGYMVVGGNDALTSPAPPYAGPAQLTVSNGATLTETSYASIGQSSDSAGTATVSGFAQWTMPTYLQVGASGNGTLNVLSGGTVAIGSGGKVVNNGSTTTVSVVLDVGQFAGSFGTVTVDGAGSKLSAQNAVNIGDAGTGTLIVQNGGSVTESGATALGNAIGSHGSVTIASGGQWSITGSGSLDVGRSGQGVLLVTNNGTAGNGGQVTIGSGGSYALDIGRNSGGGSGTVTVTGSGAGLTATGAIIVGDSGFGTLTVKNGGSVQTSGSLSVGSASSSQGTVTVNAGTLVAGSAIIGGSGTGVLTVQAAGTAQLTNGLTIANSNSFQTDTVTVTGAGSALTAGGNGIVVGNLGTGVLNVQNQGSVSAAALALGGSAILPTGGKGTVALSGTSTLNVTNNAVVWSGSTLSVDATSAIDIGGTNDTGGTIGIEAGHTLMGSGLVSGPVANNGTILALGSASTNIFPLGSLEITGVLSGTGQIQLGNGGVLRLDSALSSGQPIAFGTGSELILNAPGTALTNAITGLSAGDKIDFNFGAGVSITSVGVNGGTVTVMTNTGSYQLTNVSFAPGAVQQFYFGTDIVNNNTFQDIQLSPHVYAWTGGTTADLGTLSNWQDTTFFQSATVLPDANTQINFLNNPGTLTGTATGLNANFNNFSTNSFAGWVLNSVTLTLAGQPSPPFSAYALGFNANVTINGGTLNAAGTSSISSSNGATVTAQNGAVVTTLGDTIGNFGNQSGTLVLNGAGVSWTEQSTGASADGATTGFLSLGQGFGGASTGSLVVENGATLNSQGGATLGFNSGNLGAGTVTSSGIWNLGSFLTVGLGGDGTLGVSGGTVQVSGFTGIAQNSGASGTVSVSSGTFSTNGLNVGGSGQGTLTLSNGVATSSGFIAIGQNAGGQGLVSLTGTAALTASAGLTVGSSGSGTLTVSGGTVTTGAFSSIGQSSGASGTVSVTNNGLLTNTGGMNIGSGGAGTLTVNSGGIVTTTGGIGIGQTAGAIGSVSVTGGGHFDVTGTAGLVVGGSGAGALTLNGGEITDAGALLLGNNAGGYGVMNVTSAAATVAGNFVVGNNAGDGTVTIGSGGTILTGGTFAGVGNNAGASGELIITSGGTFQVTLAPQLSVNALTIGRGGGSGSLPAALGSVIVTGAGALLNTNGNALAIATSGGTGSLTVAQGGSVVAGSLDSAQFSALNVGANSGGGNGQVTVTDPGSMLTANGFAYFGRGSAATLVVKNGGSMVVNDAAANGGGMGIGAGRGSSPSSTSVGGSGIATVTSGGVLNINSKTSGLTVGGSGVNGALEVDAGGTVLAGTGLTVGTATLFNGTTYGGTGQLNIGAGGVVRVSNPIQGNYVVTIGSANSSIGTSTSGSATGAASGQAMVSGPGALLDANGAGVAVGWLSSGELTVSQGGTVLAGSFDDSVINALSVGRRAAGSLTITDAGSGVIAQGIAYFGRAATGNLVVENGGVLRSLLDPVGTAGISIGGLDGIGQAGTVGYVMTGGSGTGLLTNNGSIYSQQWLKVGVQGIAGALTINNHSTAEARTQIVIGDSTFVPAGDLIFDSSGSAIAATDTMLAGSGVVNVGPGGTLKSDGAHVAGQAGIVVGAGAQSIGALNVTGGLSGGAATTVDTGGDSLTIGQSGRGAVTVTQGGTVLAAAQTKTDSAVLIGQSIGATGFLTISDAGSELLATGQLDVGGAGSGTVLVQNGGALITGSSTLDPTQGLDIGRFAGGSGAVTVSGPNSALINSGRFIVGDAGIGNLTIQSGGFVDTMPGTAVALGADIGVQAGSDGSSVNVIGKGSEWMVGGGLTVGDAATGLLSIAAGGSVVATTLDAGVQNSGSGVGVGLISLAGPGTQLSISGDAVVGDAGSATMSILNGATFNAANLTIGSQGSGVGAVQVSDMGSVLHLTGTLNIGTTLGVGELTIGPNGTIIASKIVLNGQVVNEGGLLDPNEIDILAGYSVGGFGTEGGVGDIIVNDGTIEAKAGTKPSQKVETVIGTIVGSLGTLSGTGSLLIDAGSTLDLQGGPVDSSQTVTFAANTGALVVEDIGEFTAIIGAFQAGDTIYVNTGASGTYTPATFSQNGWVVSVISSGTTLGVLDFASTAMAATAMGTSGALVDIPCFAAGTRIRTERGEVAVEDLREGDRAWTMIGESYEPVQWIGHRHVDCRAHPKPEKVWPVVVSAGAFGPGLPARDVWLSPDHALFVNDVLIPAKLLVNGSTIRQVQVDEITYYHVELPWHEVLLAEGMPAESYLDVNDRASFANGGGVVALHPEFGAQRWETRWEAESCAPLHIVGPEVAAARAMVEQAAQQQAA